METDTVDRRADELVRTLRKQGQKLEQRKVGERRLRPFEIELRHTEILVGSCARDLEDRMNKIMENTSRAVRSDRNAPGRSAKRGRAVTALDARVNVGLILKKLASQNREIVDWKVSISDLMTLAGMDSSIGAQKILATELRYSGDMNESALMSIFLHREVMMMLDAERRSASRARFDSPSASQWATMDHAIRARPRTEP